MTIKQGKFCSVWTGNNYQDLTYIEWVKYDPTQFGHLDGPAVIYDDGRKEWWLDGKPHRTDGPAYIDIDEYREWYLNGKQLNTQQVENWIQENSINLSIEEGQAAFVLRWS